MTTQVRIQLAQNPHKVKVEVVAIDSRSDGFTDSKVVGTLTDAGQEYVGAIWDNRELTLREVPTDPQ
ncbi:hypothetical protein V3391_06570 [Luteimonas sp. SMYT11W]|uniref:Uncharacterized protein n=1 Tax=Luteimonas flava TaxID=3115822 RepID=A0ABU7WFA9_9GAMM